MTTNTLAYYGTEFIIAVKSFMLQATLTNVKGILSLLSIGLARLSLKTFPPVLSLLGYSAEMVLKVRFVLFNKIFS